MHKKSHRLERIAEQIQQELASIIQLQLKDPRMGMITITMVNVSRDLSHAKVYFSLLDKQELKDTLVALDSAKKFIRTQLASRMKFLRIIPALSFHYDITLERGNQLSTLIENAIASDKATSQSRNIEEE